MSVSLRPLYGYIRAPLGNDRWHSVFSHTDTAASTFCGLWIWFSKMQVPDMDELNGQLVLRDARTVCLECFRLQAEFCEDTYGEP